VFGVAAMMAPATSPSLMNLMRAPVDRTRSTSSRGAADRGCRRSDPLCSCGGRWRRPGCWTRPRPRCQWHRRRPRRQRSCPCRTRPWG
jgi:hypothetical protein